MIAGPLLAQPTTTRAASQGAEMFTGGDLIVYLSVRSDAGRVCAPARCEAQRFGVPTKHFFSEVAAFAEPKQDPSCLAVFVLANDDSCGGEVHMPWNFDVLLRRLALEDAAGQIEGRQMTLAGKPARPIVWLFRTWSRLQSCDRDTSGVRADRDTNKDLRFDGAVAVLSIRGRSLGEAQDGGRVGEPRKQCRGIQLPQHFW